MDYIKSIENSRAVLEATTRMDRGYDFDDVDKSISTAAVDSPWEPEAFRALNYKMCELLTYILSELKTKMLADFSNAKLAKPAFDKIILLSYDDGLEVEQVWTLYKISKYLPSSFYVLVNTELSNCAIEYSKSHTDMDDNAIINFMFSSGHIWINSELDKNWTPVLGVEAKALEGKRPLKDIYHDFIELVIKRSKN